MLHVCAVRPFVTFRGDITGNKRGYLIGWNTAAFKCLVVTIVTTDEATGCPTLKQVYHPETAVHAARLGLFESLGHNLASVCNSKTLERVGPSHRSVAAAVP